MKQPVFTGTCTAVVTPFTDRGVNYDVLAALLDRQLAAGVEAVVLCGTTGEAAAMTEEVAHTMWAAKQLGDIIPIPQEDIDKLNDRYQNVYGQH